MDISDFSILESNGFRSYRKEIGSLHLDICVGLLCNQKESEPTDLNLDINNYNYVTIEISLGGNLLNTNKEHIYGLQGLNLKKATESDLMVYYVSPKQLKLVYNKLRKNQNLSMIDFNSNTEKLELKGGVQGICIKCGLRDNWGSIDQFGRIYCFKHIPGF